MFEQHPVPQQVSSYQFKLVGDMTLKQFFQVAAGALLGLLVYASPIPAVFKWPTIIFFVMSGAAIAFLPFQERPLEQWVLAFFKAVYGPTLYIWQKPRTTVYFAPEEDSSSTATQPLAPTSKAIDTHTANLEEKEKSVLGQITSLFTIGGGKAPQSNPVVTETLPSIQQTRPPVVPQNLEVTPKAGAIPVSIPKPQMVATPQKGFVPPTPIVPKEAQAPGTIVSQTLVPREMPTGQNAQFSPDAAPPLTPSQANIIVGQVMDKENHTVDGAIMEIKDQVGRPVRALKTNRVGHFMIVTPLSPGSYKIFIEKEGLTFDPINVTVNGSIISPIAIHAK